MATRNTPTTSTLEEWRVEFNELATDIGNVSESSQGDQLTTVATDIVGAINELETNINDAITSSISWTLAGDSGSSQSIVGGNTATFTGGTGIDTTASATDTITLAIDSTVATLTGSQTLTNKTLTTPIITEIDSGSTITLDATTDIVLDADGGDVFFKNGGTTYGSMTDYGSGDLVIYSGVTQALRFGGANMHASGTINSGAITSTGVVTATGFTIGSAVITEAELEILDGASVTTAELNILDGVTSTAAELNILDGVTSTAAELNLLDGGTSVGSSITLADADGIIVNDGGTMKTVPASAVKTYAGGSATYNGLINGDFTAWQRALTFDSTNSYNNDNSYTADRWLLVSEGNDIVDVTRQAGDTDTSLYSIGLNVQTINKKFGIVQIIEQKNCGAIGEIGTSTIASLSFKAKVSSTSKLDNVKAAVISWNGTADSVTSDIVSAWNSEGTNPTLKTNLTYENTPANLSVTTSWVRYKIENISVDTSGTNNVIVFIWSDVADTTAGHSLYITDVQLEPGDTTNDFRRDSIGTTLMNCQRYWQEPGNVTATCYASSGTTYGSEGVVFGHTWTCEMRTSPTITYTYAGRHGTVNRIYRLDSAVEQTITWVHIFSDKYGINHGYGGTPDNWAGEVGSGFQIHVVADAEL